jgi:hypothetical protein
MDSIIHRRTVNTIMAGIGEEEGGDLAETIHSTPVLSMSPMLDGGTHVAASPGGFAARIEEDEEVAALAESVALLEQENARLAVEARDLERELQRRARMHEGAMERMRDMQREHSAHVEVLTSRVGSLGRQLEHCASEVFARSMHVSPS